MFTAYIHTGQTKVALLEAQTHVNLNPLESYIGRTGAVWAVIFHTGKPFRNIILKRRDN